MDRYQNLTPEQKYIPKSIKKSVMLSLESK